MKQSTYKFDELTQQAIDQDLFRGAVIRVERLGELLFEKAWGHALWNETRRTPLQTEHLFDLASLSKIFTATAILRLFSTGEIQEDTLIIDLLAYKNPLLRTALAKVDVSSLLDHSSGIHYWYPFYTRIDESFESILASVMAEHPRKKGIVYSDLNFMLLGLALERITGKTLPQAMQELVFAPLGLESAAYHPDTSHTVATEFGNRIEKRMVSELGLEFSGWRDEAIPLQGTSNDCNCYHYFSGAAGHAGIFADAADVARLGNLYMAGASSESGGYLDSSIMKAAVTNRGADRGYGFQFGQNYPQKGFGHTGFTGTYLHINPASGLTITVLTNRLHVSNPQDINPYRRAVSESVLMRGTFLMKKSNSIK
ncbi:MAG: beta-lactamase family protein [Bacteroidetes bacterium]|nr:beta-lactamase family protein [Bacteroidota bacterium]